jgi:hypothetical protein
MRLSPTPTAAAGETPVDLTGRGVADTVFIACAALGKELRELIRKHGWNVELRVINSRLHMVPSRIGPAVDALLTETAGRYDNQIVVYGHCGADDLDEILARHGAVRTLGPHCYEMFGGEGLVDALTEQPGTFMLTDFLVKSWNKLVVKGLKLDQHPELAGLFFANYTQVLYLVQEHEDDLVAEARRIADSIGLPLRVETTGYGDLERRLVAIMEGRSQPVTGITDRPCVPGPVLDTG